MGRGHTGERWKGLHPHEILQCQHIGSISVDAAPPRTEGMPRHDAVKICDLLCCRPLLTRSRSTEGNIARGLLALHYDELPHGATFTRSGSG